MVDIFALSIPHVALLIAVLRLMRRDDLDRETAGDANAQSNPQSNPRAGSRRA
ncbi:MAG: hypothetical protein JSR96_14360 [Proteobacteria bacterium]|nr:hypothetical protein [Pseudomonadota bacterium]